MSDSKRTERSITISDNLFLKAPYDVNSDYYIRFIDNNGEELAYWDSEEWKTEPKEVMDAILRVIENGWKFSLKAGDYVTWIDPDRGSACDKIKAKIDFIEHRGDGESCLITFEDGTELGCYYTELLR